MPMRITVASSHDLLRKPWGAVHHFPGIVSDDANRLVVAYKTAKRVHEQTPDAGSAAMLEILTELAAKRVRSKPTGNYAERASVKADRELFESVGIPLSE